MNLHIFKAPVFLILGRLMFRFTKGFKRLTKD